jgi:hypothetical protein
VIRDPSLVAGQKACSFEPQSRAIFQLGSGMIPRPYRTLRRDFDVSDSPRPTTAGERAVAKPEGVAEPAIDFLERDEYTQTAGAAHGAPPRPWSRAPMNATTR